MREQQRTSVCTTQVRCCLTGRISASGACRRALLDWEQISALSRRFKMLSRRHATRMQQTALSDWIFWKSEVLATKVQRAWHRRKLLRLRQAAVLAAWSWHARRYFGLTQLSLGWPSLPSSPYSLLVILSFLTSSNVPSNISLLGMTCIYPAPRQDSSTARAEQAGECSREISLVKESVQQLVALERHVDACPPPCRESHQGSCHTVTDRWSFHFLYACSVGVYVGLPDGESEYHRGWRGHCWLCNPVRRRTPHRKHEKLHRPGWTLTATARKGIRVRARLACSAPRARVRVFTCKMEGDVERTRRAATEMTARREGFVLA